MPTNFVSPGASMVQALQQMMVERETQRRQAFLDSLAKQREDRENRIQTEQLASLKDQRDSMNEGRQLDMGVKTAGLLKSGQVINDQTEKNLGPLAPAVVTAKTTAIPGVVNPTINPDMSVSGGQPVVADSLTTKTYTGTDKQITDEEHKKQMQALIDDPHTPLAVKQALQYEQSTGRNAPAGMFEKKITLPTSAQEYEYAKTNGYKGSYEQHQNEAANRHKPVVNVNSGAPLDTSPEALKADMNDVLMGKQTLFNIRQTMGRNNQSASYMQKMRAAIKKEDPDFDFVASDAGGKAVSSTYYQKGISSINGVMPNLDKIVQISHEVPRIGIVGVDALLQRGAMQFNGKNVTSLHQARKLLADEIGVALGQGSVSDMKLQLGFDISDPAVSDEVFASNIGLVKEFLENRKKGLNSLRYHSAGNAGPDAGSGSGGGQTETPEARKARLRKAAGL